MKQFIILTVLMAVSISFAFNQEASIWAQQDQRLHAQPQHGTTYTESPGATKTIIILHGLHESPYFMRNWATFFAERNYNVLNVRLPGHFSKDGITLKTVQSEQWLQAADKAYESIQANSQEIAILGYSTGGTLAAYLALKHPDKVKNLFLISPAFTLSKRVFLSTAFAGLTNISSVELCRNPDSYRCKLLKTDPEFKMMVENGLEVSPQAGKEVQNLIEQVFGIKHYGYDENGLTTYGQQIISKLLQIQATIAMANSRADVVINELLNQHWIGLYTGKKFSLMFPKEEKIYHGLMNKNPATAFKTENTGFNIRYKEVEDLFLQSMGQ